MKKLGIILLALVAFTAFALKVISTPDQVLYLLNWGEYIDETLVDEFEAKFNCQVVEENVTSSEAMYQKITSGTTTYDVAVPGDYTVHQLYNEGKLKAIDVSNPQYENLSSYKTMFSDSLKEIMDEYMVDDEGKSFDTYYMPYFWGAYSLLYSRNNPEVDSVVQDNGFEALYDRSLYSSSVKIGMYDTSRWIVASYLLSQGKDPNIVNEKGDDQGDFSKEMKDKIIQGIRSAHFDEFANDQLKRDVANGSIDLCFTQLGDFFDALYLAYDSGIENISFHVNVPKITSAFFDSLVIPTTCHNYGLANEFINFMMDKDHGYQNARAIGYSPTLKETCEKFEEEASQGAYYYGKEGDSVALSLKDFLAKYPMYLNPLNGVEKAYLLKPKSVAYLTSCETIFNSLAV